MLGFVKDQQHLTLAEIETQVAQNPVDRAHSDRPTALRHPLHQVQRADPLTNIDVVTSPALSVLGAFQAVQFRDQVLQDVGLLGSGGTVEVIGAPMIQGLVEVPSQQTGILGLVELSGADCWSRNGMGRNEVSDRGPDEAVVGGDPAVMAIQKLIDRFPGIVDAAGKIWGCHAGPGQVVLQLQANFGRFRQACLQQLSTYRVGKSHGLLPFRQFPNNVVDEVGTGCGVQILRPYQSWWRWRLLLPWHFGSISILEVRDLATVPGTSPYGRQASNEIGDCLTSRAPDPHRSSNVFVANRSAGDQLLGPQPSQEPAVQVQGDGFPQIGWVASYQDIPLDLQKQLGQTLAIGRFVAFAIQLHASAF